MIRDRCAVKSSHHEDVQKFMFWMLRVWTVLMWKPNLPVGEVDFVCRVARAELGLKGLLAVRVNTK